MGQNRAKLDPMLDQLSGMLFNYPSPLALNICVSESGEHWFRWWLDKGIIQTNALLSSIRPLETNFCVFYFCFVFNTNVFTHKTALENIVCSMASISSTVCVYVCVWGGGVENKTLAQRHSCTQKRTSIHIDYQKFNLPLWCWFIVVICMYDALFHMPLD